MLSRHFSWYGRTYTRSLSSAVKEVKDEESSFVFCGCFYRNVDRSDQIEDCLWLVCFTFYCKCVMQRGTRTGPVLVSPCLGLDLLSTPQSLGLVSSH